MIVFNKKKTSMISKSDGFSLLEVLIAVSILSVGMLAVATMQTTGMQANLKARTVTEACTVASQHVERLMTLPFSDAWLDEGNNPQTVTVDGYNITWNVFNNNPVTGSMLIRVVVNWTERGQPKVVPINTVRTRI